MTVLYILVPIAIVLVIIAVCLFNWAVNNGQYEDLDSPAHSILFDEDDPAHLAAQQRENNGDAADNEQKPHS
ncbi:cytochrome oxidase maturation protein, cbb3-type [Halopseudomonas pachastrellae]|jgi:cbb3-type cytochrome oxidase maturation protein|uniref:Cytochrome oxidase maturation protein, cbb3-type n=1 Tax=Halopseudomonas pachastrellae TaxID=254161 RepID=A0A1S8DF08_9GAMM|nr:cbb3-type cytochrome oxidase assembly protein CcoS [Halopseudomonas pachastrellae]ONM44028.1 cytochrome oxidase maturation protein, cbb3-type [Halopseudomonas pachastrellae]SFM81004.1 cytochrome oxidase maturation protein, cbb3-type [Halopseudomonas pachastrellae]